MPPAKPLPTDKQIVLVEDPIYTEYDLTDVSSEDFAKFVLKEGTVDAYCLECKKISVFCIEGAGYNYQEKSKEIPSFGIINIEAKCSRDGDGIFGKCSAKLFFCFNRDFKRLIKIGQYPSQADLDFGRLDPVFSKELDKDLRQELGKAIGLKAHGVGVGSFVYLRRIFEKLIENALSESKKNDQWNERKEASYQKSRIPERIQLLKQYLPNRLVQTSALYGILSKGIHELSEQECLSHFDLVQKAILMILKESHEEREYQQTVKDLHKAKEKLTKPKTEIEKVDADLKNNSDKL
jgi:hypothetical protein